MYLIYLDSSGSALMKESEDYVGLVNGVYPNPLNPQRNGDTVTVPAPPGCISDGNTKEEAIVILKMQFQVI